jgi:hypothetical protein
MGRKHFTKPVIQIMQHIAVFGQKWWWPNQGTILVFDLMNWQNPWKCHPAQYTSWNFHPVTSWTQCRTLPLESAWLWNSVPGQQRCNRRGIKVFISTSVPFGKGKVHPRTGHEGPERKKRYSSTLSLTSALDEGGWSTPRPGHFTPGKDPVPLVQEAGWALGPVWTGAENLAPPGFDPWPVQPRTSCYTDWAIPAPCALFSVDQNVFLTHMDLNQY